MKHDIQSKRDECYFYTNVNRLFESDPYEILALSYTDTVRMVITSDVGVNDTKHEYDARGCVFVYILTLGNTHIVDCHGNHYKVDVELGKEHGCGVLHLIPLNQKD